MGNIIPNGGRGKGGSLGSGVRPFQGALQGQYLPPQDFSARRVGFDWNKVIAALTAAGMLLIVVKILVHKFDAENRIDRNRLSAYDQALGPRVETVIALDAVISSGAPYAEIMAAAEDYEAARINYNPAEQAALKVIIDHTSKPTREAMTRIIKRDMTGGFALMDGCLGRAMNDIREQHTPSGRARRQFLVHRAMRTVDRCFAVSNRQTISVVMADYEIGQCAAIFRDKLRSSLSRRWRRPIREHSLQPEAILAVCRPLATFPPVNVQT